MPYFHVSSARNRASIDEHGLDWQRMGAARGIAGSTRPEVAGVFLCCDESERDWFVGVVNNTGGPVDVWEVTGVDPASLLDNGSGHLYLPARVPRSRIALTAQDLPSSPRPVRPARRRTGPG